MRIYQLCFFGLVLAVLATVRMVAAATQAGSRQLPLLMPDNFSALEGVSWRVEQAEPDANNPLIEGEMPWDRGGVMTHGTVLRDPLDGRYKAWLICTPAEERLVEIGTGTGVGNGEPRNQRLRRLCYFESSDGVTWMRPKLPNSAFGKDFAATNIVFDDTASGGTQYASVMVNRDNTEWPYEMFVYRSMYGGGDAERTKMQRYQSRDGRRWEHSWGPIKGPFKSDVCFVYRARELQTDAPAGAYVAYYRIAVADPAAVIPVYEAVGDRTRQLFRTESPDGRQWADGDKIVQRDERDHRDTQYMELVPHRMPGGFFGVVSVFHPLTQTQDLRMAVSRNGRDWWFPDRRPCLANAPLGDYGGGMIWQSRNLIAEGDRLFIYYSGSEGLHEVIMDTRGESLQRLGLETILAKYEGFLPFNSALCRASWRADRLYALVASAGGPTVGVAVTQPDELAGLQLRVNFVTRPAKEASVPDLDGGYLQIELLDAGGKPIPGFTRDDCDPLRGDERSRHVTWAGGATAPAGARQARLYLKRAFLYAFGFSERK